ncbi:hypothetical protein Bca52824_005878 [Brassica carinata]|uniref:Uncharacterized protein n=1 Tax=Brassica carinata TaxID=52824 RepID=A0A8X7WPL5_BRACI|nr:hypothetical protein Bca52824_005878 [Brassica carinata]
MSIMKSEGGFQCNKLEDCDPRGCRVYSHLESVTVFVMDAHQTITLFVIVMLAFMRAFAFVSQFPN